VNYDAVVRATLRKIGYDAKEKGIDYKTCNVIVAIEEQSPDIAGGVHVDRKLEDMGAGDQGHMFGYATDEHESLMPLTHWLATQLGARLTEVRNRGILRWVRPDGKTQVTIEYRRVNGRMIPLRVHTIVISTQHDETVTNDQIHKDLKEHVIDYVSAICPPRCATRVPSTTSTRPAASSLAVRTATPVSPDVRSSLIRMVAGVRTVAVPSRARTRARSTVRPRMRAGGSRSRSWPRVCAAACWCSCRMRSVSRSRYRCSWIRTVR
jgi:hypothetical protein